MARSRYETGEIGELSQRHLGGVRIGEDVLRDFGIELDGDWNKLGQLLRTLPLTIRKAATVGQRRFAEQYKKKILQTIHSNGAGLSWDPLQPSYKRFKTKHGGNSGTMYQFFGVYVKSIKIKQKDHIISIGIHEGQIGKSMFGDLTVGQYANVLEHGSVARGIPARPLWSPVYRGMGGNKTLRSYIIKSIKTANV